MDHSRFDEMVRQMVGAGETRRALFRLLAAGALSGVATRIGLATVAANRVRRPLPKGGGSNKRKKKRARNKKRASQLFGTTCTGQRCLDGSCAPAGSCCSGKKACPDGTCVARDVCCPDAERPACGACDVYACDQGEWVCQSSVPCEGGTPDPATCTCTCPNGKVLLTDGQTCCDEDRACGYSSGWPTTCCDDGLICVGEQYCS